MGVDKLALAYPAQGQYSQCDKGDEDEAQCAVGMNRPAQQQAEPAKIGIAESGVRRDEGTQDAEEKCRQEGDDEAIGKGAERGTAASTGGIAIDACCTAGEEVRHQTRQNQSHAKGWVKPSGKDGKVRQVQPVLGRNRLDFTLGFVSRRASLFPLARARDIRPLCVDS
mgnify:CR=1 FL=1